MKILREQVSSFLVFFPFSLLYEISKYLCLNSPFIFTQKKTRPYYLKTLPRIVSTARSKLKGENWLVKHPVWLTDSLFKLEAKVEKWRKTAVLWIIRNKMHQSNSLIHFPWRETVGVSRLNKSWLFKKWNTSVFWHEKAFTSFSLFSSQGRSIIKKINV